MNAAHARRTDPDKAEASDNYYIAFHIQRHIIHSHCCLMELEAIKAELRNYIRETHHVPPDDFDFSDSVHLYDYGYVDSFGAVQLKMFVETKFSVQFNPSDLTTVPLNTVEQVADFVVKRKNRQI